MSNCCLCPRCFLNLSFICTRLFRHTHFDLQCALLHSHLPFTVSVDIVRYLPADLVHFTQIRAKLVVSDHFRESRIRLFLVLC